LGAVGTMLGAFMAMGGIFLSYWVAFEFTDKYVALLLFLLFGVLGGLSLGALNSRKAKTQAKYKNEYIAYAGMFFAATVLLAVYHFVFDDLAKITAKIPVGSGYEPSMVLVNSFLSGILTQLGLGLVIANSLAEN